MEILALIFFALAVIVGLVFGIQLLILAFQTSIWWGLGYVFIPFVGLIFVIVHWNEAKTPFLRGLLAIPLYVVGFALMPEWMIDQ